MLEVTDLHISYNGIRALNGVSLKVGLPQSIAIIGPNGSGKSTFLKGIAGVVNIQKGTIFFEGEDITYLSPLERIRKSIMYLPQSVDVFPSLSVQDNLLLFTEELSKVNGRIPVEDAYSLSLNPRIS